MSADPTGSIRVPADENPPTVVGAVFGWGWRVFRVNAGPMIVSSIVIVLIAGALNIAGMWVDVPGREHARDIKWFLVVSALLSIVNNLFSLFIQVGVIRITLRDLAHHKVIEQSSLFTGDRYRAYVGAAVIATVGTAIGLVLFIVPGIVWFTYTIFFGWFVIDRRLGPWAAVKASMKLAHSRVGPSFLFIAAFFGCYLVGAVALMVGLIVAAPVTQFALAWMYKYVQGDPITVEPVPPPKKTKA